MGQELIGNTPGGRILQYFEDLPSYRHFLTPEAILLGSNCHSNIAFVEDIPHFFIPHLFGSRIFPYIFTARSLLQDVGTGPHDLFAGHLLLADHWLDGRVARAEGSYGRASGAK